MPAKVQPVKVGDESRIPAAPPKSPMFPSKTQFVTVGRAASRQRTPPPLQPGQLLPVRPFRIVIPSILVH